ADDAQRLREVLGRTWREAFYLVETNFTGELGDGTAVTHNALRVFRNRPEYRFTGRIHEQIADKLPEGQPERIEITDVRVEHYGYLGVVRDAKDKSRRNIELLERQRDEAGEDSGFLHFNLGSEYAALGENAKAHASLERSWRWPACIAPRATPPPPARCSPAASTTTRSTSARSARTRSPCSPTAPARPRPSPTSRAARSS